MEALGLVAVVATLSKGYDLDYIWKQVDRGPTKDAASYYIQASESGGEPPGRWWGPGARALGFEHGQRVERQPYDLLFGERKAPGGTPLGRPPGSGRKAADLYAALLAAEPHATAERKRELRIEATRQARQSPLFFDLTLSLSKSISIFHASLGENARLARQAGDQAGDQYWSALVTEVDDMIWQAVWTGFGYFQREAGYTRTGSHNSRVHGRETGQWHEADLAVAHWLQHTSRDGDMQLHVHSQIAHIARTLTDGRWRAPDSLGYNEHIGAVAAVVSQHLEEALTRRFGLEWVARDDGHGFEIKGISGQMMRVFSSRRESITADARARAARFEQRYGRKPSQRELAQLAQASNFTTRTAKTGTLDFAQLHAGWADKLARTLGVPLASVAPSVWHNATGPAATPTRDPDGPGLAELELARAAQKAVALAQQEKSTWTRADVIKYLGRVLPRSGRNPAAAAAMLERLADRALRGEFEPVTCLEAPEPVEVPRSLLRADGRSIYQRHGGVRYATRAQLAMEERMLAQASASGAPRMTRAQAARALGADPAQLEDALAGHADDTRDERTRTGLREDQAAAALSVLTDGQRVSVVNAPAGSGKTRVLAEAARAWAAAGLGPVIGITPSQSARNTLYDTGTPAARAYVFTLSPKLADPVPGPRPAPELARHDRLTAGPGDQPTPAGATGEALTVLSGVLDRDGQQLSATQTRNQALSDADQPGPPARDLGRRDHPRPRPAVPGPAHGDPAARVPQPAQPPGEMAVAHPASRRTRRAGRRAGPGRRDRRAGPGRRPRHPQRPRRPDPQPRRFPGPAPSRAVVRAAPRHRRPRPPRLRG